MPNLHVRRLVRLVLLSVAAFALLWPLHAVAQLPGETPEQHDARMKWFREARFGMFIHWGLYAIPAGEWNGKPVGGIGEWIMNNGKITPEEYRPLAQQFNPTKFDAKAWVRLAKNAGMKYIVITTKHHDGFALFDSKVSDYDIMSTPFKRDVMKELADAAREEGVVMCWYHSIMDWDHPDYLPRRAWDSRPTDNASFDRYRDYLKAQLKELTSNYGRIGVMWFDGEWEKTWTHEYGSDLYRYVRSLQNDIIINNRVDKGRGGMQGMTSEKHFTGDYGTPEQQIPATGLPGVDWESCMTMNGTWGFKKDDHKWKSTATLVRNLIDIVSKGGNYLLNVGPTAEGVIPQPSVERLEQMGAWMKVNGEAVYATQASPIAKLRWGRITRKPGRLYLHVFNLPADRSLQLPGLRSKVKGVTMLADASRTALNFEQNDDGVTVSLPQQTPVPLDPIATVLVLEYEGDLLVEVQTIKPGKDGSVTLPGYLADLHGPLITVQDQGNIGRWTRLKAHASWAFTLDSAGAYEVVLDHAVAPAAEGGQFVLNVGGTKLEGTLASTGGWQEYKPLSVGKVQLPAGVHTLKLEAKKIAGDGLMNVRGVTLKPAK